MTMLAPCRASSRTIAWPIPLLPPVTMATLFFSDMVGVLDDALDRFAAPQTLTGSAETGSAPIASAVGGSASWLIRLAISPVQPVWWDAPQPRPLSPWKYSWNRM